MAEKSAAKQVLAYSSVGLQLAITLLIFVYGGYKLDRHYHSEPWFLVGGTIIGMVLGFYNLYKELSGLEKSAPGKKEDRGTRRKWL